MTTVFDPSTLGPQKDDRGYFISYRMIGLGLPEASWSVNDEDAYNFETDRFDARKVQVKCPGCARLGALLLSPHTRLLHSDWRWVGVDHKEPYSEWVSRCRCGTVFRWTTHTPQ